MLNQRKRFQKPNDRFTETSWWKNHWWNSEVLELDSDSPFGRYNCSCFSDSFFSDIFRLKSPKMLISSNRLCSPYGQKELYKILLDDSIRINDNIRNICFNRWISCFRYKDFGHNNNDNILFIHCIQGEKIFWYEELISSK